MNRPQKALIPIFMLFLFTSAYAQLDSLKQELSKASGEKRVDVLNKIAFTFGYSNYDSARYFGESAYAEAQNMGYAKGMLDAYVNIGYSYFDEGRTDTAIFLIKKCLTEAREQGLIKPEMDGYLALGIMFDDANKLDSAAWAYQQMIKMGKTHGEVQKTTAAIGNLGNLYRQQGLNDMAVVQYMEAAEINMELGNDHKQANYLSNIGSVYLETEDYEKALEYFAKAYELTKNTDYTITKWQAHTGLCLTLNALDRFDEAEEGFVLILEEARALNDQYQIPTTLHNLADLYNDTGRQEEALRLCFEALERFEGLKATGAVVQTHTLLCSIYANAGLHKEAFSHCEKAEALAYEHQLDFTLRDIYKIKSEALDSAGEYKAAYIARLKYEEIKDEQQGEARKKNIAALNARFESKEKEFQIEVQKEKLAAQEKLISQQHIIQLLILLVLIAVATMAILARRNSKKQKEINIRLSEQKQIIEKTSKERETLLKEIHHRVKNNLQVISSLLSMQSRQMEDGEAKSAVREGQSRIKSMSLIHQKLYSQDELSRINMKEYIAELSQFLFKSYKTGSEIQEVLEAEDILLDVDTAVPLGLIINELIANALKYAFEPGHEGMLKVAFVKENEGYMLQVSDNGKGLPSGWESLHSMGMRLVNILVDQLNGDLKVENNNGSTFIITFKDQAA